MTKIIALIQHYPTISALISYYVLSAAIGALPAPRPDAGLFYQWFFKFTNTLAGNLTRAFSSKLGLNNGPAGTK
jgi:hypothetical protein